MISAQAYAGSASAELRRVKGAKAMMAVIDLATVIAMLVIAVVRRHEIGWRPSAFIAALAASMFVWHRLENTVLPRRYGVSRAPIYPGGLVWPNLAYSAVLCVATADWLLAGSCVGVVMATSPSGAWVQPLGLSLFIAGVVLRGWAFSTLGERFLADPREGHPTERRGPYRWMRHPANGGFMAISLGTSFALASGPSALTALALCGPALVYAGRREERERRVAQRAALGEAA